MRFNTRLLIDVFYKLDAAGKMHMFMRILDEGTHLHGWSSDQEPDPAMLLGDLE